MPADETTIDAFIAAAVRHYRAELAASDDAAERRLIEDAIALLIDYRLADVDERAFDALSARMGSGRVPVAVAASDALAAGMERFGHWQAYRRSLAAPS